MSLLQPITALAAALVAIPILLALYFLKLRRRSLTVPSTLLWSRAIEDLEANTPFQRLRWSWLLLLQLLGLLLLLGALARPIIGSRDQATARVIVLVDISASMAATDGPDGEPRMEQVKRIVSDLIDRLDRRAEPGQMMLIAFGARARVLSPFTSNRSTLRRAVTSLTQVDETAVLAPALRLAEAYLSRTNSDEGAQESQTSVVLVSDGRLADRADELVLKGAAISYLPVGRFPPDPDESGGRSGDDSLEQQTSSNIGIVLLSARRTYQDPARVELLCVLASTAPVERTVAVRLHINDQMIDARTVKIPAATWTAAPSQSRSDGAASANDGTAMTDIVPGEVVVWFDFHDAEGAVVRVSHNADDILQADDSAGLVLDPPGRSTVLLVSPRAEADPFLTDILSLMDSHDLEQMSLGAFDALAGSPQSQRIAALSQYSLIVFDRASPAFVPPTPTLSFAAVPPDLGVQRTEPDRDEAERGRRRRGRRILSWDRQHPVMANVGLDAIAVADPARLQLPEDAVVLAFADGGPIIGLVQSADHRHLVVAPELVRTNWPIHTSFPIFLQNAVEYLTMQGGGEAGRWLRAGQSLQAQARAGVESVTISGSNSTQTVPVDEDGTVTIPPRGRVGYYTIPGVLPPNDRIMVNLLSAIETTTVPVRSIRMSGGEARVTAGRRAVPRELWPWLIAAVIAVLLLEWVLYSARSRHL